MNELIRKNYHYKTVLLASILCMMAGAGMGFWWSKGNTNSQVKSAQSFELINSPIYLTGNKSIGRQVLETAPYALHGQNVLFITYNLHGLCALQGDASTITFKQKNNMGKIILADQGKNCFDGEQTITIPLSSISGLNKNEPVQSVEISFWYPTDFSVDILRLTISAVESNVLGIETVPTRSERDKTYAEITPLRPSPYAAESIE